MLRDEVCRGELPPMGLLEIDVAASDGGTRPDIENGQRLMDFAQLKPSNKERRARVGRVKSYKVKEERYSARGRVARIPQQSEQ